MDDYDLEVHQKESLLCSYRRAQQMGSGLLYEIVWATYDSYVVDFTLIRLLGPWIYQLYDIDSGDQSLFTWTQQGNNTKCRRLSLLQVGTQAINQHNS